MVAPLPSLSFVSFLQPEAASATAHRVDDIGEAWDAHARDVLVNSADKSCCIFHLTRHWGALDHKNCERIEPHQISQFFLVKLSFLTCCEDKKERINRKNDDLSRRVPGAGVWSIKCNEICSYLLELIIRVLTRCLFSWNCSKLHEISVWRTKRGQKFVFVLLWLYLCDAIKIHIYGNYQENIINQSRWARI